MNIPPAYLIHQMIHELNGHTSKFSEQEKVLLNNIVKEISANSSIPKDFVSYYEDILKTIAFCPNVKISNEIYFQAKESDLHGIFVTYNFYTEKKLIPSFNSLIREIENNPGITYIIYSFFEETNGAETKKFVRLKKYTTSLSKKLILI